MLFVWIRLVVLVVSVFSLFSEEEVGCLFWVLIRLWPVDF